MTKWITCIVLSTAVVALGAYTLDAVEAGNFASPSGVEYFAVRLTDGQYITCSDSTRTILIDDITYSMNGYQPCNPNTACDFFTAECLPDFQDQSYGTNPPNVGPNGNPLGGPQLNYWSIRTESYAEITSQAVAYGILMSDADGEGDFISFDEHDVSSYGQCAKFHSLLERGFQSVEGYLAQEIIANQVLANSSGVATQSFENTGGGLGLAEPTGISMYHTFAVTSDSRHYQTPYVVQLGRVYMSATFGGGPSSSSVFVKGRTVPNTSAPVVASNIVVNNP